MNRKHINFPIFAVALAAITVFVPGCQTDEGQTPVTPEDLFSHLNISLGATNPGEAAFNSNNVPAAFDTPWTIPDIDRILGPNSDVRSWPEVQQVHITARRQDDHMNNTFPPFPPEIWPDLDVAGGTRYGNIWGTWGLVNGSAAGSSSARGAFHSVDIVAQHFEWIRRPVEITGTTYHFDDKFLESEPCNGCPFGFFAAGPSRHTSNIPLYQRVTNITWWQFNNFSAPFLWPDEGGGGGGEPVPAGPPEVTEIHIYVTNITITLLGGTTITVPATGDIGDVELFAINGTSQQVADSPVPVGQIVDIQIHVDEAQSWVRADGQVEPLILGTGQYVIAGPWSIPEGNNTTIALTIDIDASLTYDEDNMTFSFDPMLAITVTNG